ncbi:UNVERIFIED_CONTAM: hypothetical protein FKN15_035900 [Acipenser sinensis]
MSGVTSRTAVTTSTLRMTSLLSLRLGVRTTSIMENRKEMVMFTEGRQLGTLVGKIGPNLSEAVGSPVQEPQEKMVHGNGLSPRSVPLSRERGDEEVEDVRSGARTDIRPGRVLSPKGKPQSELLSNKGHHSSSDTESDFYEEIDVSCSPNCTSGNMDYANSKGKDGIER